MSSAQVLIVEDEVLIADTIKRHLTRKGYEITGMAISYEEALALYREQQPDIVLLDIRLSGPRTGIDIGRWLREQPAPSPFVYLTSQLDQQSLEAAKATFPAGYLSKPVQPSTLYTTLEIALHNQSAPPQPADSIRLYDGKQHYQILVNEILYLRSNHIYVQVRLKGGAEIEPRSSLKELISQMPEGQFVQTHRSYAINIRQVSRWDQEYIYLNDQAVPISRSRRREVLELLQRPW